jgi:molybdate transport system regulatory protein
MQGRGTDRETTMSGSRRHKLSIRIDLAPSVRLGPGKIALLEAIDEAGSISGAGRKLKMSYKKAWDLTEDLNRSFAEPLLAAIAGGANGGGTQLTPSGRALVTHYREIERIAQEAAKSHIRAIGRMVP